MLRIIQFSLESWANSGAASEFAWFVIDAYSSSSGTFTLAWRIDSGPVECGNSFVDLDGLTSPVTGSTSQETNDYALSCGGNGNEAVFRVTVRAGATLYIGQSTNGYDSRHELSHGVTCPGTSIICRDDPVTFSRN